MVSARSILTVSLPSGEVGRLGRNRHGSVSWRPDPAWEAAGQHPRLGVAFLRSPGPCATSSGLLPAWFENLLPERDSALRYRLCQAHQVSVGDSFGLLGAIGRNLPGAVEVASLGEVTRTTPTAVEIDLDSSIESEESQRLRFSLAGMQLKFSMSMVNDRLQLGAVGRGTEWVVKLPGASYPELPEVEHATMNWARNAGFDVPAHFMAEASNLDGIPEGWNSSFSRGFAVQRFDRRSDGSKIHQEDLCQGLSLLPNDKYGGVGSRQVTFDSALRFVADVAGEDDAREMARRLGFAIASGNDDAHLKNWSLLWGNAERPSLAPCYDLVATVSWRELHGWGCRESPRLALSLGGEHRFSALNRRVLERLGAKTGTRWVADEVMTGIERARDSWDATEGAAPELMRDAVFEHWRNVPLLREMQPLSRQSG